MVDLIVGAAVFATHLSPAGHCVLTRVHRPSARHVAAMFGTVALVATAEHSDAHGFGGV